MSRLRFCFICLSVVWVKCIAEIVYGMPDYNDELVKELEEGKIELGGA